MISRTIFSFKQLEQIRTANDNTQVSKKNFFLLKNNLIYLYNMLNENLHLPQELKDKIFLYVDYSTLENCRELQSDFVKTSTENYSAIDVVKNKNLKNSKWLEEQDGPLNKMLNLNNHVFAFAAYKGDLDILKWLKEQNCPWDSHTFDFAAENGNLENMKWLYEQGCTWSECTFDFAAENGNLENMKWLKEQGCPWDSSTFCRAAEKGDLKVLEWLKEQGCPWNEWTLHMQLKMVTSKI